MTTLDDTQRATLLDRLFRRIGKLDDDSLIRLEQLTRADDVTQPISPTVPMAPVAANVPAQPKIRDTQPVKIVARRGDPDKQSRRYFLMALVAGGVLAASAGGVGAIALSDDKVRRWLRDTGWLPTTTPPPPTHTLGPTFTPTLPIEARNQIALLQGQVTTLTTQRDSLQSQVTDAHAKLNAMQTANADIQGLLDLYKQLESIGLDDVVVTALAGLGVPVLAVETIRQTLDTGIALTARVLQGIEEQMPLIAAGLDWLDQQVKALANGLLVFEQALQVTSASDVTQAITNFISTVLDLLPFGVGQDIKAALQAMGNVIVQLPILLDNVSTRVLQPARAWIVSGNTGGLYDLLLTPLRSQLLAPAQQMVANAQNLNQVYNSQLAQPAQNALVQRAKIRAEITKKAGALPG